MPEQTERPHADPIAPIDRIIDHSFERPELLKLALRHASSSDSRAQSNERLEFLGDAVLGMIVCQMVFERFPDLLEGEMTKIKSMAVSRQVCAELADELGLAEYLVLGKGVRGRRPLPQSIRAAVFEAIIGAIYVDADLAAARRFLEPLVEPVIERAYACGHQQNFKSVLQMHAQQSNMANPNYYVLDEKGPDHAKCFEVCVEMGDRRFSSAWGQSKKQAEQQAALNALHELGVVSTGEDGHVRVERACDDPDDECVVDSDDAVDCSLDASDQADDSAT